MPNWDDEPEPFVTRALEALAAPRATPVLEVGCGGGRHLRWLERHGFAAYGTDRAADGLARTTGLLRDERCAVRVALADMRALPFADGRFGAVIAHHVLYHGTAGDARRAIVEAGRVLRAEGLFIGTLLSTRAREPGAAERHRCDESGARELLAGFDVDGLALDEFSDDDGTRHSHWRFMATRR
jgi:SAM-dependent methyltransferase